ncbi:aminotransferase class IV [Rhodohalobacter sp.]|uniref:aminotransferase class IV n=1 Tax=Rhodohalobacter sp. TaxID=1974210 RepID=UPI002ACE6F7F|nr:aminotransferase class IV [Rhodohalobacter sp.]MDZ7757610.1 aminotransferase class IV [Rhodohalobacter sp.]
MSDRPLYVCLNGNIIKQEEALIPANNSALYYGTSCFETLLVQKSRFFKLKEHIDRLNRGMAYLSGGKVQDVAVDQIKSDTLRLLKENQIEQERVKVRIQFSLMEESGYSETRNPRYFLLITVSKAAESVKPLIVTIADTRVVPSNSRPADLKLSNMLHYRQAWREAKSAGVDDAILLTTDDVLAETSIGNLFWKKDDVIYTPSTDCDILPGIMRNSLIDILTNKMNLKVMEGKYRFSELKAAESVWMTNSVREIQAISEVDGREFETDQAFIGQLKSRLKEYKTEHRS